jgi:hypothetical protein
LPTVPSPLKSLRFVLAGVLVLVGSLTMVTAASAGAPSVGVTAGNTLEQPTFGFEVLSGDCADNTVVTVDGIPDATVDLADPNSGTITVPVGQPGGSYDLTVVCDDAGGDPLTSVGFLEFHRVTIEKVVTGTAPDGAAFGVNITCGQDVQAREGYGPTEDAEADGDPFMNADLSFGAAGGSTTLVGYQGQTCTVFEFDAGGATSATVVTQDCAEAESAPAPEADASGASGTFDVFAPIDCTQTVTNDFAAPAAVVQQQPAFTG